ncbi:MAG: DUF4287 domain-containing protein [Streptosporangiales bacterium]|nr:DUF4287 domain-containing protein [Streptosporangiales bacterium]
MADPKDTLASQLRNIEQATGRTVGEWTELIAASGNVRHGRIVAFLKSEHGLTHGNANALAREAVANGAGGPSADADLLDAQFRGAKAALRPVHDELVLVASALGGDVGVAVKKTGVSLRRKKQFAFVNAPSAGRIRLGLNLRDEPPTPRLSAATGMCTHHVDVGDVHDVDDELVGWLRSAYDRAG